MWPVTTDKERLAAAGFGATSGQGMIEQRAYFGCGQNHPVQCWRLAPICTKSPVDKARFWHRPRPVAICRRRERRRSIILNSALPGTAAPQAKRLIAKADSQFRAR